ncbi:amidohydrolase family protein [Aquabacterium sp. OR-4]|uniref:amidohydrolase family protein n=1 Tax=Aquabacterium sp. OR-4 TaxID=2978127 RepID=UPI0028C665AA|nr:amidohydrolase family protein [Aquabacterium sp. OR-4]MDT7839046.1 amidohydrolase family protein [Aquabacterium sp. OR-4]
MDIIDIHPHIISDDPARYPVTPLFGKRSEWSKERPSTVQALIAAMDAAGVAKAAVVHSSTTYGFDNSYVTDGCASHPGRLVPVCSVDMVAPDAVATTRGWVARGLAGLRIFTGGSTKDFDPAELEDPRAHPVWELLAELGLPMCLQTGVVGLPQVTMLARRFPGVNIVLDHLARPELADGPPYAQAASLFALADLPNVYLKLSPRIFAEVQKGQASASTFFPTLVAAFGVERLAWGSNYPTSPGTLAEILAAAQAGLAGLDESQRAWIFGKTAQKLYKALR